MMNQLYSVRYSVCTIHTVQNWFVQKLVRQGNYRNISVEVVVDSAFFNKRYPGIHYRRPIVMLQYVALFQRGFSYCRFTSWPWCPGHCFSSSTGTFLSISFLAAGSLSISHTYAFMYRRFLSVRYSFLLISNKLCDVSLLHLLLFRSVQRCGRGVGQCGTKNLLYWALEARCDTALQPIKVTCGSSCT